MTGGEIADQLGARVYQLRTALGLSQDQLARLASTSQGAVSRVEACKHANTPLLTYVKLFTVLARGLSWTGIDLVPELRTFVDAVKNLVPLLTETEIFIDPNLDRLIKAYQELSPDKQVRFTEMAMSMMEIVKK